MLSRRVIVCLDVEGGRVVKGVQFESLREIGDPAVLASRYELEGADEIVLLNIAAHADGVARLPDIVRRTAERLFIPLTVGGGIGSVEDAGRMLRAGADKISINSASVARPEVITEAAEKFGSQCVVASIDARREQNGWRVYTHGGRNATSLDAASWAARCSQLGAGEILITSIDRDGTRDGFDLELTSAVARVVTVPVIASGGGGGSAHIIEVLSVGGADAALMAGAFHDGTCSIEEVKTAMRKTGLPARVAA
ncbi:MAG: imidazole glycerol phosphate synthase subunit HisF [Gemmatimonadales bacterium]